MAIPLERPRFEVREDRLPLYGARAVAFAAYLAALLVGLALLGPALTDGGSSGELAPLPDPQLVEVRAGDTLAGLAADEGVSVSRLLALNPDLGLLGPEPGETLRVR